MAISSSAAFWSPGCSTLDEKKSATVPSDGIEAPGLALGVSLQREGQIGEVHPREIELGPGLLHPPDES